MNKLAIVIPAYKSKFFRQTLESISNQSYKDFTLYIGDDASPDDIKTIVDLYCNHNSVVYKRFENNLGEIDLVAHWERCIDLTREEEWIWLFSDDDVMSNDCVEGFYETLKLLKEGIANKKVFRFNLGITDSDLNLIHKFVTPGTFSVEYFLENYFISHKLTNRAVEFIFSRATYYANGKFVNFPLAWGSDTATMLKFGQKEGFITMVKGEVLWRSSDHNISAINNHSLNNQKASAYNQYYLWIFSFIQNFNKSHFFYKLVYRIMHQISGNQVLSLLKEKNIKGCKLKVIIVFFHGFIWVKRIIRFSKIKLMISNLSRRKSK